MLTDTWFSGLLGKLTQVFAIIFPMKSQVLMIIALSFAFPGGSDGKASAYNAGDLGSIPGLGRSSGEGSGTLLQYSCLENPMDGGAWWATVHGVAKSWTQLSDFTSLHSHPYMTTGKTIALTRWTFVSKEMSLLFNTLSRFVIAFLSRSKRLLIS